MKQVIGPILSRDGGYAFDTWAEPEGLERGFAYRRIEDAYYARNRVIKGSAQGLAAVVCQTVDDFLAEVTGTSGFAV